MLQTINRVAKWVSLPILLVAAIFLRVAGRYELLLALLICLGAVIAVRRAVWKKEYLLATGFVSIALVFSPFLLLTKIFLLMSLAAVATGVTLFAAFRPATESAARKTL